MERDKRFFRNDKYSKGDIEPKRIIIKNRFAKIYPKKDYLVIVDENELVIGYRYILEVYINVNNSVPLRFLYSLAKKKKVFLIDARGYVVGEINVWFFSDIWYKRYKKSWKNR